MKNNAAFTLIELVISIALFSVVMGLVYSTLNLGQNFSQKQSEKIVLNRSLSLAQTKITDELQMSGIKNNELQVEVKEGDNGDILKFSVPILCRIGDSEPTVVNEGFIPMIARWGAPLKWGCNNIECFGVHESCGTSDYEFITYSIDNDKQLIRKVFSKGVKKPKIVREDIIAQGISGFIVRLIVNEDINHNEYLEDGEDANGDGVLNGGQSNACFILTASKEVRGKEVSERIIFDVFYKNL